MIEAPIIEQFFNRLSHTRKGLLLLDYDGTLAPFHLDRLAAFPAPGITDLLLKIIATNTTKVVFVTGRPSHEILKLVQMDCHFEIWGCHGREHRTVDGTIRCFGVTAEAELILAEGKRRALTVAGPELVESKVGCVAIHWRPLSQAERLVVAEKATAAWQELVDVHKMQIHVFDGGIELSVPGRSKGDAIDALLLGVDTKETAVACLGDDMTDEDGFRALGDRGLSVLVKNFERETAAQVRVTMPDGVLDFLSSWHDAVNEVQP